MNSNTAKFLKNYAVFKHQPLREAKKWWKGLTHKERAKERIKMANWIIARNKELAKETTDGPKQGRKKVEGNRKGF